MEDARLSAPQLLYELVTWHAGHRLADLHLGMQSFGLRLLEQHGLTVMGCWVPCDANPRGTLLCLLTAPDLATRDAAWQALAADADWQHRVIDTLTGSPADAAATSSILMYLTGYSPHPQATVLAGRRVFEFRDYEAAPGRLADLNARFRDHTMRLFEKHDMHNLAYWNLLPGQHGSDTTLFYMLWHRDRAGADAAFQLFLQDAEWKAALAASQVNGSLVAPPPRGVKSQFYEATPYSPLR